MAGTELPGLQAPMADLAFPELTARPVLKAMMASLARMERLVKAALRERLVRKARPALTGLKVRRAGPETANRRVAAVAA